MRYPITPQTPFSSLKSQLLVINGALMPLWSPFVSPRLLEEFENHIEELKQLDEKIQRRVEKLEHQCHREAKEFAHKVQDLQRSNQVCFMFIAPAGFTSRV